MYIKFYISKFTKIRLQWLVPRVIWADFIILALGRDWFLAECGNKQKYENTTYNWSVFFETRVISNSLLHKPFVSSVVTVAW